jgi:hypothetical protein
MDVTGIIGSIPLTAALVYVSKKAFDVASGKVKKWDKHVADDAVTHAVIQTKMDAQEQWLKNIDGKLDKLVDKLL